jgi:hypothetical protein
MPVSAPVLELEDVPMLRPHMLFPGLLAVAFGAVAGEPTPEIQRKPGAPQAIGVAHTLRTIPEACARLEGRFTGDAAAPYRFTAVRSSARCQPRARLVDAAAARPSAASGWVLNDVVRVPNAGCPSQQAVVRVWRKDAKAVPPKLDAQGRSRIYLKEGLDTARGGDLGPIPMYAAAMDIEGKDCGK